MHNDDETVGRLLTRRELVALFGAAGVAAAAHRLTAAPAVLGAFQVPNCVAHPRQTQGPYFVDAQLLRSDIRSDPATGVVKDGALFELNLNLTEVAPDGACKPLVGASVDIWQCDAMGAYSDFIDPGFKTVGQRFLRGYQLTDAGGRVKFQTIYPGWYPDRTIHIHFKVRWQQPGGTGNEFVSQLYFEDALTDRIHAKGPYLAHTGRRMRNHEDSIFRRGGSQLILPVTEQNGTYASTFGIGVAPGRAERGPWGRFGGVGAGDDPR